MAKAAKNYSNVEKNDAFKYYIENNVSIEQVADDLNMSRSTIRKWATKDSWAEKKQQAREKAQDKVKLFLKITISEFIIINIKIIIKRSAINCTYSCPIVYQTHFPVGPHNISCNIIICTSFRINTTCNIAIRRGKHIGTGKLIVILRSFKRVFGASC